MTHKLIFTEKDISLLELTKGTGDESWIEYAVVRDYDAEKGDWYHGSYVTTLADACAIFNERVRRNDEDYISRERLIEIINKLVGDIVNYHDYFAGNYSMETGIPYDAELIVPRESILELSKKYFSGYPFYLNENEIKLSLNELKRRI